MLKSITKMTAVAALLFAGENVGAQCPFTATVTPNNLILCPSTQDTLWTQVYDSYQWYKAGQPIAGATNQYLVVDHFMDAGSEFSVEVTASNCTEMSDTVLVDGWAFLPPLVMHEGSFQTDPLTGTTIVCPDDSFYLILLQPYTTSIQWFKDNQPITGATDDTLMVNTTGGFTVEGAPDVCPSWVQQLGVTVDVIYNEQPVISQAGNALVSDPGSPAITNIQWYKDGSLIPGATNDTLIPTASGNYHITAQDAFCTYESLPFNFTLTSVGDPGFETGLAVFPNPSTGVVTVTASALMTVEVYDQLGRMVVADRVVSRSKTLNLTSLPGGLYTLKMIHGKGAVTRQVLLQ